MWSRLAFVLSAAVIAAAGCSPGPGRVPIFPDASVPDDAGFKDAATLPIPDAGQRDASPVDSAIALPDAGPEPEFPFTGVFGILNASDSLYAREVDGKISLVVGNFPYEYIGTISDTGVVDAVSNELVASGCTVATITGNYDRRSATFGLLHRTCSTSGAALESTITGGFAADFDPARSGVYELDATVMSNPGGCFTGAMTGHTVRYGFSFLPSRAVAVFTAIDLIPTSAWYQGTADVDYHFGAIQSLDAMGTMQVSMSGNFTQVTANDPVRFTGLRDVYDPVRACGFTITLDGLRIAFP